MSARIAVMVPCHRRKEYTEKCIKALESAQSYEDVVFYLYDDCSKDGTDEILSSSTLPSIVTIHGEPLGLRATVMKFFEDVKASGFDYIAKMDNDCVVPANWLNDLIGILNSGTVDIVSPNVSPSNAAYVYGSPTASDCPFMPSTIVGGLWCMKADLIRDVYFEPLNLYGIKGAFQLLNQIIIENQARVAWAKNVTVQDIGHWSGNHPDHIKSEDHATYSQEVGRDVNWVA